MFNLSCSLVDVIVHLSSQLYPDASGSQGSINCLLTLARILRSMEFRYLTLLHTKIQELVPNALTVRLVAIFEDSLMPPTSL